MKTFRLLVVTLLFSALCINALPAQIDPCYSRSDTTARADTADQPQTQPLKVLQLAKKDGERTVDRAVLEIRFNEMIDQIDRQFHTPPSLREQPTGEVGCLTGRPATRGE